MRKLAIIGASGHGKVVADIARKNSYNKIYVQLFMSGRTA